MALHPSFVSPNAPVTTSHILVEGPMLTSPGFCPHRNLISDQNRSIRKNRWTPKTPYPAASGEVMNNI